jgi:hypothetical protein
VRWLAVVLVWCAATAAGLWVAAETKVGPVVFVIDQRHGIHQGDLIAFGAAYGCAALLTIALLLGARR